MKAVLYAIVQIFGGHESKLKKIGGGQDAIAIFVADAWFGKKLPTFIIHKLHLIISSIYGSI